MTSLTSITESAGHIATPLDGATSWVRKDGSQADMRCADHYPIFTRCKKRHGPIWLASQLQMEWSHLPAKAKVPAALAGEP
jgi:hypothetical protein